ncbi:MAG: HAD-IA family hydrolase [Proteobacteria bacterium]|nr:HAD-IA family hydrolase [Pseudomonadota bacterium]
MSRLIVFDLDGTLVDSAPDLIGSLNAVLAMEGIAPVPVEKARDLVGAGVKALLERGLAVAGRTVSPERFQQLFDAFFAHYADHIADRTRPYPGVIEALETLKAEGWRFAICTNKLETLSVKLVAELRLTHWFAANCGGDTFSFRKPDARHLTETIRMAGGADIAIMVGDSETDVTTARNAGLPVIGVPFGYTPVPMVDLKPDVLITAFSQLAAAVRSISA